MGNKMSELHLDFSDNMVREAFAGERQEMKTDIGEMYKRAE